MKPSINSCLPGNRAGSRPEGDEEPSAHLHTAANDEQSDRNIQRQRQQQRRGDHAKYRDQRVDYDEPPEKAPEPPQLPLLGRTIKF
jgi:hypothetical protein